MENAMEAKLARLKELFVLRSQGSVHQYLHKYPFLADLLMEAYVQIQKHFGPDPKVELDVVADHEVPGLVEMFGYIVTGLTPEEAGERLQQFDRDWFLKQLPRVKGLLNFDILPPPRHEGVKPRGHAIPNWIREWAKEFEKDGVTLEEAVEEARRISRKFKTPLSEEIIAEREEQR